MRHTIHVAGFWLATAGHLGVLLHEQLAHPRAFARQNQGGPIGTVTTRVTLVLPKRGWRTPTHALLLCWTALAVAGALVVKADPVSALAALLWLAVAGDYLHTLIRRSA